MARKKKYKSIISYRKELERINDLMVGLVSVIMVFKKLPEIGLMKPKADVIKEIVEQNSFLEFGKERIDNIYELGFIRLFASFEAFMYEYLKELYTTYPNSMPTDRKIQVSDIMEWKTQKSVRAFILDHIAIENSYDHITWEKTLKNSFGIEIFEDEKEKQLFESLNLCRNMIAHSGGKTNSKVVRELKRIFNKKENESELFKIEKWDIFDKKIFNLLKHLTSRIVDRIEKNNA